MVETLSKLLTSNVTVIVRLAVTNSVRLLLSHADTSGGIRVSEPREHPWLPDSKVLLKASTDTTLQGLRKYLLSLTRHNL